MRAPAMLSFLIITFFCGHSANADFRIQRAAPEAAATSFPDSPTSDEPASRKPVQVPVRPRVPLANGFGRQIPLSFAARQIVPANLPVSFAPDVDQDVLVDWSGGRPWPQVIAAVVQPFQLRAVVTARGVLIGP